MAMMMTMEVALLVVAFLALSGHASAKCQFTDVETYTTTDKMMSSKTVFIAEFGAKCSSDAEAKFYAAVGDAVYPVVASTDGSRYQVSWADTHKASPSGSYSVRIYSEEGYAALRRAQRSSSESDTPALDTITVSHPGLARTSLFIQTELIALVSSLVIFYAALSVKGKLSE